MGEHWLASFAVLALDAVKAVLNGQAPKKIIVVPLRIVNIVL